MNGYMGKILRVDLSTEKIDEKDLKRKDVRDFIGGSGLGAKFLYELTGPETDPLGEDNVIIFMTGPLTGTKAFSSDRFEVITKSPLTGIYAESDCGGRWGSTLKRSGYDGIIIRGKAKRPVYLWIHNRVVEIRSAAGIWGLDTFQAQAKLKKKNPQAEVACIGPAGERLVKYAAIVTSGVDARVTGRAGCGAVMGAKKLKAIVVSGDRQFSISDQLGLDRFFKKYAKNMVEASQGLRFAGTSGGVPRAEIKGDLPIKNYSERRFKYASKISGQEMARTILKKRYYCGRCVIGCGRIIEIEKGPYKTDGVIGGPEYETIGMMGSNLLIHDIKAIAKFNELCNRYGMDTISTGSVLAMVMECYERGLVSKKDLDGIDLIWGNSKAVITMINKIGRREGVGKLLGEGTKRIAEKIGSYAGEFALHVKGLETPAHDPRALLGLALEYATSNRGACHLQAFSFTHEYDGTAPEMGFRDPIERFETNRKPELVMKFQHLMSMIDSLHCCKFIIFFGVSLNPLVKALELVTGLNINKKEFLRIGERIFNLKRLYNIRCGITRKDDVLPHRLLMQKRGSGKFEDKLATLGAMLDEYYKLRDWDEIGVPRARKIKELGLTTYVRKSEQLRRMVR